MQSTCSQRKTEKTPVLFWKSLKLTMDAYQEIYNKSLNSVHEEILSECSCPQCDTIRCFTQKRHTGSRDISSTSLYPIPPVKNSKYYESTGDFELKDFADSIKENCDDESKNNRFFTAKGQRCTYNVTPKQKYEHHNIDSKTKKLRNSEDLNLGGHCKRYSANSDTANLSAQIMNVPFKDLKETLQKQSNYSTELFSKLSYYEIMKKITEAYNACSCKVCECLATISTARQDCACKPCNCDDCANLAQCLAGDDRQKRKVNKIEEVKPHNIQSCKCEPCCCIKCTKRNNKVSNACVCKPCECTECKSLLITNAVTAIRKEKQRTCNCEPCECILCKSTCMKKLLQMSVMNLKNDRLGDFKICDKGCEGECKCEVRKCKGNKLGDHRVTILSNNDDDENEPRKKPHNHDAIAMFATISNNCIRYDVPTTNNYSDCEDPMKCEESILSLKNTLKPSQKVMQFQQNDMKCHCSLCKCELCTKNKLSDCLSNTFASENYYYSEVCENDYKDCHELSKPSKNDNIVNMIETVSNDDYKLCESEELKCAGDVIKNHKDDNKSDSFTILKQFSTVKFDSTLNIQTNNDNIVENNFEELTPEEYLKSLTVPFFDHNLHLHKNSINENTILQINELMNTYVWNCNTYTQLELGKCRFNKNVENTDASSKFIDTNSYVLIAPSNQTGTISEEKTSNDILIPHDSSCSITHDDSDYKIKTNIGNIVNEIFNDNLNYLEDNRYDVIDKNSDYKLANIDNNTELDKNICSKTFDDNDKDDDTLQNARTYSEQLKQILRKYEKANREFHSISKELKEKYNTHKNCIVENYSHLKGAVSEKINMTSNITRKEKIDNTIDNEGKFHNSSLYYIDDYMLGKRNYDNENFKAYKYNKEKIEIENDKGAIKICNARKKMPKYFDQFIVNTSRVNTSIKNNGAPPHQVRHIVENNSTMLNRNVNCESYSNSTYLPTMNKVDPMPLTLNEDIVYNRASYQNKALANLQKEVKNLLDMPMLLPTIDAEYHQTSKQSKHNCYALKVGSLNVRRVSDHTILLKWTTPILINDVRGYELQVDGRAVKKIFNPSRNMAVVTCLPHGVKIALTLKTILSTTPVCGHCPSATIVYQPRTK